MAGGASYTAAYIEESGLTPALLYGSWQNWAIALLTLVIVVALNTWGRGCCRLASILIASLSVAMLLGGVAASTALGRQADTADEYFYETLTAAENRQTPVADGTVKLTENGISIEIPVQIYGGEGLYSYSLDTAVGGPAHEALKAKVEK